MIITFYCVLFITKLEECLCWYQQSYYIYCYLLCQYLGDKQTVNITTDNYDNGAQNTSIQLWGVDQDSNVTCYFRWGEMTLSRDALIDVVGTFHVMSRVVLNKYNSLFIGDVSSGKLLHWFLLYILALTRKKVAKIRNYNIDSMCASC